ncbi:NmrA family NAD(P)-binding protein [Hoeflea sp. EC-HK425]|uniref:NAD(P)H-binding protein n=1 Tax=Hoeflea sp. EC-HK425 TaxID=2038388 RepID=UPI001255F3E8|nr:NmrA family NAD(P)-binding protein [Hoeflea sp. EC-HK425]VVT19947.1 putative nucleoside-diphosphate sugar epimerase [Hoeflea sp. EC-HK425]|tara:strand:+ start:721 stop:1548 length:828 start_codon:yes stop_codon:yes gene_type:complete
MNTAPILVIGSTGKTGNRIVRSLTEKGFSVREGSRNSAIPFDWEKPETWAAALAGVKAAYVSYFPDLAFPGAAAKIEALTKAAKAAGVRKLVLLSGRGEAHARHCEEIVRNCGLDFTLVRAAWFAQNFSEGYLQAPVLDGVVALPAGDIKEPIADVDDIADVAVAALTDDRHNGELYEITGPRLLTFAEAAAEISSAAGIPVQYMPITLEQFHAGMLDIGGPLIADVFTEICRETLDGHNAYLTDGVQRALGRAPRDFADFCSNAAAGGAWKKAA